MFLKNQPTNLNNHQNQFDANIGSDVVCLIMFGLAQGWSRSEYTAEYAPIEKQSARILESSR